LAGCAQDIHQRIVTTDNSSQIAKSVTNDSSLTDDDKTTFSRALNREGYQPYGKTVARIISDEHSYDAAEKTKAAQQAALQHALDKDIEISLGSIQISKGTGYGGVDEPYRDVDTFTFIVFNKGLKAINTMVAAVDVKNRAGDILFSGNLEADGLSPKAFKTVSVRVTQDYSTLPNPELVRNTDVSDAVAWSLVNEIFYSDGTKANRNDSSF
jgi:hypothetical protein